MSSWFHFRMSRPLEDPAVSVVEQMLDATYGPQDLLPTEAGKGVAEHALWICGCVTHDDPPTWLIWDTAAGGFAWRRVPDKAEPLDLVDAKYTAGGHTDPAEVLRWLRGGAPDPWGAGGSGNADPGVLEALHRRIMTSDLDPDRRGRSGRVGISMRSHHDPIFVRAPTSSGA